jgi:hypothetical protein
MKTAVISAIVFGVWVAAIPGSAQATLHGFCDTVAPCTDNGTNTPTSVNPPDFGFSAGGQSASGDLMIDILVPDNVSNPSTTYTISGPLVGASTFTASLFSATPWTSGQLDSYLGISASPTNPIGAYLLPRRPSSRAPPGFSFTRPTLGPKRFPGILTPRTSIC